MRNRRCQTDIFHRPGKQSQRGIEKCGINTIHIHIFDTGMRIKAASGPFQVRFCVWLSLPGTDRSD